MTQDQNSQTINSNNHIIEQVSEQELQDITGGCIGCGLLSGISAGEASISIRKALATGSIKEARNAVSHAVTAVDTFNHISPQIRPCKSCIANTLIFLTTKGKE